MHFIGSSIVNISSNTELDIIVPGKNTGKVVINGDAEQLAIRFASPESDQSIVIEINGQVDQIALSGSFNGEIVFTGSGNIGAVNTEGDPSDAPSIRFEGELEVGTVNGRPAAEPQPAASPSPGSGSSSRPVYYPSVTEAVYTAYANHATFEIEAADAAKIYYAAMHPASDEPSARKLKEMASGTDAEGMRGTVTVSEGTAAVTITRLGEAESYVLYVSAESPDGTLSEVYKHPFVTDTLKIVSVNYTRHPYGQIVFTITFNTFHPTSVYWLLTDKPDDDIEPSAIRNAAIDGCDADASTYCGFNESIPETDTVLIILDSVDAGFYYLYATAEGRQLSPVYRLEVPEH